MSLYFSKAQQLELVIQASNIEDARKIVRGLNIEGLKGAMLDSTGAVVIAKVRTDEMLDEGDYRKIAKDPKVAIVRDSESERRGLEILHEAHKIESLLREVLMHAPQLTGMLYEILCSNVKTGKYKNGEVTAKELDCIANHLTFGGMVKILGYDLSIKLGDSIPSQVLKEVLDSSDNFEDFKSGMLEKYKENRVWDILSKDILENPIEWKKIKGSLEKVQDARNKAAHLHVITPNEPNAIARTVKFIQRQVKIKKSAPEIVQDKFFESLFKFACESAVNPELYTNPVLPTDDFYIAMNKALFNYLDRKNNPDLLKYFDK